MIFLTLPNASLYFQWACLRSGYPEIGATCRKFTEGARPVGSCTWGQGWGKSSTGMYTLSANPMGSSRAGVTLQSCLKSGWGNRGLIPTAHWPVVERGLHPGRAHCLGWESSSTVGDSRKVSRAPAPMSTANSQQGTSVNCEAGIPGWHRSPHRGVGVGGHLRVGCQENRCSTFLLLPRSPEVQRK